MGWRSIFWTLSVVNIMREPGEIKFGQNENRETQDQNFFEVGGKTFSVSIGPGGESGGFAKLKELVPEDFYETYKQEILDNLQKILEKNNKKPQQVFYNRKTGELSVLFLH